MDDATAVALFQDFLRIPSVSTTGVTSGSYRRAAEWLKATLAEGLAAGGVRVEEVEATPGKPVVVATLPGRDESLPVLLLNSHYDVVPADKQYWHVDPFGAELADDGRIYGRGTQDMKSVCVQYIVALQRLLSQRKKEAVGTNNTDGTDGSHGADGGADAPLFLRTVVLTFVPDEEVGGRDGMGAFLSSECFRRLAGGADGKGRGIGLALDEGLANPGDKYTVFYGERSPWWVIVEAKGPTGHGSRFIENPATHRLLRVAQKGVEFRRQQEEALGMREKAGEGGCKHSQAKKLGDVTTLNLTMLKAGVTGDGGETWNLNVIPVVAEAGFDIRLSPNMPMEEMSALLDQWTEEEGLSWKFAHWTSPLQKHHITSRDVKQNPWWGAFVAAAAGAGAELEPEIFPAATDSRFLRELGIRALGFSPMANCEIMLHEHNEYIPRDVYLKGIDVYCGILPALANFDGGEEAAAAEGAAAEAAAAADPEITTAGGAAAEPGGAKSEP